MYLPEAPAVAAEQRAWQVLHGPRRAPRRAVPRSWWVGLAALVLSVLVLYVHTVSQEAHLQSEKRAIAELKEANLDKRTQLAGLQNPRRIETVATRHLAMKEPKEVVFLPQTSSAKAPRINQIPPPPVIVHEGF